MKTISVKLDMNEMADITSEVEKFVKESNKGEGAVLVFNVGSTGAVTTIEYEPGLKKDFPRILDKIAPYGEAYEHHKTWHDDNGSSHVKASMIGPSMTIPFQDNRLILGTWQQIVVVNFDTGRRERKIVLSLLS
ncbi:MAG: secondary thiamine-phosphate synthase enzyme YjbQ [Archaeoglobaceae archaeon]